MGRKSLYETPEKVTAAIDKFLESHFSYNKTDLTEALGFSSIVSLHNLKQRKGFEKVFDRCVFSSARGKYIGKAEKLGNSRNEVDIQKYADSIEEELKVYCSSKKIRRLVNKKRRANGKFWLDNN